MGLHSTSLQNARILEWSNSLHHRIEAWTDIQHLYFPFIVALHSRIDQQGGGKPVSVQNIDLYLPSSLVREHVIQKDFILPEWHLWFTHAEEALDDLHSLLLMRSMMQKSKDQHMHGQRQQTRSVKLLGNVKRWIQATAEKYRSIWESLLQLVAPLHETSWEKIFLPLERSDMVGLTSIDDTDKSEGRKKLTWIWKVQGIDCLDCQALFLFSLFNIYLLVTLVTSVTQSHSLWPSHIVTTCLNFLNKLRCEFNNLFTLYIITN